ncbi:MAG TPA: ABC transporter permease [Dongiaceae bacterium]|nr:ABC transporter permease [Dongiaceae bacterium]
MPLLRFIATRISISLVTMLIVAVVIYFATAILPGDVASRLLGRSPDPTALAILQKRLGLDVPLVFRFLKWLGHVLIGDPGVSLISGQPVAEIVGRTLWNSSLLALLALLIYLPIAVIPAAIQAIYADRKTDHAISGAALGIMSLPDFLLGTFLLLAFAAWWPIFPPRSTIDETSGALDVLRALVLPAVTIALVMGTYATRYLRENLIEVLNSDYVRMARLNGIRESTVLWRHAFPNALVPTLNVTSLSLTYLFGGVVVVEKVFAFPGFGNLLVSSLMQLDVPVIQATVLVAAAIYVAGNLVADLLTVMVNPRLRYQ